MEKEENGKLNFLDVSISKHEGHLLTSWYRKPSNTLLFTQWNSNAGLSKLWLASPEGLFKGFLRGSLAR